MDLRGTPSPSKAGRASSRAGHHFLEAPYVALGSELQEMVGMTPGTFSDHEELGQTPFAVRVTMSRGLPRIWQIATRF